MPTFSRKRLRQNLGLQYLHDTLVSLATATGLGQAGVTGSYVVQDKRQADLSMSGENLYQRAWFYWSGGDGKVEYRVASFNCGSGAFVMMQLATNLIPNGDEYEVHQLVSPWDKDRMLDLVVGELWERREYGIPGKDSALYYSLPDAVKEVFDVHYLGDPSHSLDRDPRRFDWWRVVSTGSGRELRVSGDISASEQIVLDAELRLTLGAGDSATVNLPSEDWVLAGAAARCFELLARRSPGQEAATYRAEAARFARRWNAGLAGHRPQVDRKVELDDPF